MIKAKQQVVEVLEDIPSDIENTNTEKISAMGIFKNYANASLISEEKAAWGAAVRGKHEYR